MVPKFEVFTKLFLNYPSSLFHSVTIFANVCLFFRFSEYGYTYKVSEKSDVYSFGVVLLELVTGKRPIEAEFGENKDIVSWVYGKLKSRESVFGLVDSDIPEGLKEDAIKVLRIGVLCTARVPEQRPTMRSVVQMLQEAEPCKLMGIIVTKDGLSARKLKGLDDDNNKLDHEF